MEYARFLQDTVKEMAKEVQNSGSGEKKKTAEDLDDFINMVKYSAYLIPCQSFFPKRHLFRLSYVPFLCFLQIRKGSSISNEEILGFAKLFNDELTLDNINRLVSSLCLTSICFFILYFFLLVVRWYRDF